MWQFCLTIEGHCDLRDYKLFASREKSSNISLICPKNCVQNSLSFSFTTLPLTVRLCTCATISRRESAVCACAGLCLVEATVIEGPGDGGFKVSCREAKSAGALLLVLQPPAKE